MTAQTPADPFLGRLVLIPADPAQPVRAADQDPSYRGVEVALNTIVEPFIVGDDGLVLWMDANGKSARLPANRRATLLAERHSPGFSRHDFVAGDAVLAGSDPDTGAVAGVPAGAAGTIPA